MVLHLTPVATRESYQMPAQSQNFRMRSMSDEISRRNLELKAPLHDVDWACSVARTLGASDRGELHQTDTYFRVDHGRLKLRETVGQSAELIFYDRPDRGPERWSRFWTSPAADPQSARTLLAAALSIRGTVMKRRRLFTWRQCRIHIDEVEGLGAFIEFEVLASDDETDDRNRMSALVDAFEVDVREAVAVSYVDLLRL